MDIPLQLTYMHTLLCQKATEKATELAIQLILDRVYCCIKRVVWEH